MRKNELIVLDAKLTNMINKWAFHAELSNGHSIVAFARQEDAAHAAALQAGSLVKVALSPYDMSRGRIVFVENRVENES